LKTDHSKASIGTSGPDNSKKISKKYYNGIPKTLLQKGQSAS